MYEYSQEEHHKRTGYELPSSPHQHRAFQTYNTSTPSNATAEDDSLPPPINTTNTTNANATPLGATVSMPGLVPPTTPYPYSVPATNSNTAATADIPHTFDLAETFPGAGSGAPIDFNSSAFLYDTGLFGQIMFDETKAMGMLQQDQSLVYPSSTQQMSPQQQQQQSTTDRPSFLPPPPQQQQQQQQQRQWYSLWRN